MEIKKYQMGHEGRAGIEQVARQVGDILGKTLGPAGRNYMLPSGITNDGRTIMSELRWKDECLDQASLAFHEVARMTDKDVGDGTTTSIVLAAQLTLDLLPQVPDLDTPIHGARPVMQLFRDIDNEKNEALVLLKEKVTTVKSLEELKKVAYTSMENKEIADLLAEAMWEAGKDTMPIITDGFNGKVEKSVINGINVPFSIAHPSMFNKIKEAEYENVPVLVVNHSFEQFQELSPFMLSMLNEKKPQPALIIVAKSFSVPFIMATAESTRRSKFPIILVSANLEDDLFEDVAAYTDAQLINTHPKTGRKISEAKFSHVGFAKKVVAREKETLFVGGRGVEAILFNGDTTVTRVQKRVEDIKKMITTEKSAGDRETLEKRIATLLGGIVTVYIDAKTAAEKYYLKLKIEDTLNSCRAALNDGIVRGGGETLASIADQMEQNGSVKLIANALREPKRRILQNNMGVELDTTDVYDAYLVAKASIENSISVVKVLLTIEGVIADKEPSMVESLKEAYTQE